MPSAARPISFCLSISIRNLSERTSLSRKQTTRRRTRGEPLAPTKPNDICRRLMRTKSSLMTFLHRPLMSTTITNFWTTLRPRMRCQNRLRASLRTICSTFWKNRLRRAPAHGNVAIHFTRLPKATSRFLSKKRSRQTIRHGQKRVAEAAESHGQQTFRPG